MDCRRVLLSVLRVTSRSSALPRLSCLSFRPSPSPLSLLQRPCSFARPFSRSLCSRAGGEELSFDQELKQLSLLQRYKKLGREYWYVLIPVHCCTSIIWFGTCLAIVYA